MPLAAVGELASWNAYSARGETVTVLAEFQRQRADYARAPEFADLCESVARCGVLVPLAVSGGWLYDGMHRYAAARLAGLSDVPVAAPV